MIKDAIPLGYVELPSGPMAIYPMNDIFLNYTFENSANWEALRIMVNLVIEGYRKENPSTSEKPIIGEVKVVTQYRYLLAGDGKTTRDQDIRIIEDNSNSTFIELQNRAHSKPPIEIRSVEYYGLGIGHSRGKIANQIWLLAEDVQPVLREKTYARYVLKDEVTNDAHPVMSGIMYVSLRKLAQEKGAVGELAAFLLGKATILETNEANNVSEAFKNSFETFKADKEVVNVLSLAERYISEGEARGEAKGLTIGAHKLAELIKQGFSVEDALRMIEEEHEQNQPLLKNP